MSEMKKFVSTGRGIFSIFLASLVLIMIAFSGPVSAFTVLIGAPSSAKTDTVVNFNVSVDLSTAEFVHVTGITLDISGPSSGSGHPAFCDLPLSSDTFTGCIDKISGRSTNDVDVTSLQIPTLSPYGGPYGYGSAGGPTSFVYAVSWKTPNTPTTYLVTIKVFDGSNVLKTESKTVDLTH